MDEVKIAKDVMAVAQILSGAPYPSKRSLSKAREIVEYLENRKSDPWQPIETAAKDGSPILLDHPDWHWRVMRGGWDAHEEAWRVHGFGCPSTQPTHWMPLPTPPEA